MKIFRQLFLWSTIFGAFCLLFYIFGKEESHIPDVSESDEIFLLHNGESVALPLREYLIGALAAEMPATFGQEALKAQAVAIRSYLMVSGKHDNADICSDSGCCLAYKGPYELMEFWGVDYEEYLAVISDAVDATAGQYLVYRDEPIQAVFHASSGGSTEDSDALWDAIPYLVSVSTPETAESVENLVSHVYVSPEEMATTLTLPADKDPSLWIQDIRCSDSGRVKGIYIGGKAFTGAYIRSAFNLRSTDFTLTWDGTQFVFTVTGHGHGVGMSQYGAKLLAADGYTYREILAHYYPGTELTVQ